MKSDDCLLGGSKLGTENLGQETGDKDLGGGNWGRGKLHQGITNNAASLKKITFCRFLPKTTRGGL